LTSAGTKFTSQKKFRYVVPAYDSFRALLSAIKSSTLTETVLTLILIS
jgi:hypothetical protein